MQKLFGNVGSNIRAMREAVAGSKKLFALEGRDSMPKRICYAPKASQSVAVIHVVEQSQYIRSSKGV